MRDFILEYIIERESDLIEHTTFRSLMPFTKLSIDENKLLDQILHWRFGNSIDQFLSHELAFEDLSNQLKDALIAIIGWDNLEIFRYETEPSDFSEFKQKEIDLNLLKFIEDNKDVLFRESEVEDLH